MLGGRDHYYAVSAYNDCAEFVLIVLVDDFVGFLENDVHVLVVAFEKASEDFAVAESDEDFRADAFRQNFERDV